MVDWPPIIIIMDSAAVDVCPGYKCIKDPKLDQSPVTLWFPDTKVEMQHRMWQMGRALNAMMCVSVCYIFSNWFFYNENIDADVAADGSNVLKAAIALHIFGPMVCVTIFRCVRSVLVCMLRVVSSRA